MENRGLSQMMSQGHEGDGRGRRIGRLHHRDEHLDEDLEFVEAVDTGSLDGILREVARAVAEVHDQERRRKARQADSVLRLCAVIWLLPHKRERQSLKKSAALFWFIQAKPDFLGEICYNNGKRHGIHPGAIRSI